MRDQIISHIVSGHCADSLSSSRTRNRAHGTYCRQHVLRNFARDADLKDDGPSNEGAILKMVFNTISSRKTLFRVMRCNAIPCNPSDSLKQLRHILNRRIRFLDKQNASTSRLHEHRQTSSLRHKPKCEWLSPVPQTLKNKQQTLFVRKLVRKLPSYPHKILMNNRNHSS